MPDFSEKEILKGLKTGDESAYKRIFQAWYEPLCVFSVGLVRDRFQAENIVDDAFFHIWEIREHLEVQTSLKAYLFASVRNRSLNYLASSVRRKYQDMTDDEYTVVLNSLTAISKDDIYGKLFEEELKKFEPSMEVEEAEEEIKKRDLTDMTDILRQMTEQRMGR